MSRVIVVGGGAAGMMAAYTAAAAGHQVVLLEKNEKLGKKIYITGKGRCNVTNAADKEQFFQNIVTNSKFLYSSIYQFDNQGMISFLEEYGCPVKTERGGRVFPVSDHASDVTGALQRALKEMFVEIRLNTEVKSLLLREEVCELTVGKQQAGTGFAGKMQENWQEMNALSGGKPAAEEEQVKKVSEKQRKSERQAELVPGGSAENDGSVKSVDRWIQGVLLKSGKKMEADAVILACGGLSYPSTGSDGAGFRLAAQAGHSLTPCYPALVPFEVKERWCRRLQGLSLKNVEIKLFLEGGSKAKAIYSGFGEMLFTHFGVSGPLVLSASSYYSKAVGKVLLKLKRDCNKNSGLNPAGNHCCIESDAVSKSGSLNLKNNDDIQAKLVLNLKPAMDEETLDRRILRDFEENSHKAFKNALGGLFPAKLIPVMVELSGIDGERKVYDVTRQERRGFAHLIQNLPLTVTGTRGFAEAIITQGGIPVSEVNPSTMESRFCSGLYFAGEMLDIDALTGGYNLQLAWSTGHLAGASVRY